MQSLNKPSRERDQEKTLASSAIAPGYEAPRGRATRAARPEGGLTVSAGSGRKGPDEPSAVSPGSSRQKLTPEAYEGHPGGAHGHARSEPDDSAPAHAP